MSAEGDEGYRSAPRGSKPHSTHFFVRMLLVAVLLGFSQQVSLATYQQSVGYFERLVGNEQIFLFMCMAVFLPSPMILFTQILFDRKYDMKFGVWLTFLIRIPVVAVILGVLAFCTSFAKSVWSLLLVGVLVGTVAASLLSSELQFVAPVDSRLPAWVQFGTGVAAAFVVLMTKGILQFRPDASQREVYGFFAVPLVSSVLGGIIFLCLYWSGMFNPILLELQHSATEDGIAQIGSNGNGEPDCPITLSKRHSEDLKRRIETQQERERRSRRSNSSHNSNGGIPRGPWKGDDSIRFDDIKERDLRNKQRERDSPPLMEDLLPPPAERSMTDTIGAKDPTRFPAVSPEIRPERHSLPDVEMGGHAPPVQQQRRSPDPAPTSEFDGGVAVENLTLRVLRSPRLRFRASTHGMGGAREGHQHPRPAEPVHSDFPSPSAETPGAKFEEGDGQSPGAASASSGPLPRRQSSTMQLLPVTDKRSRMLLLYFGINALINRGTMMFVLPFLVFFGGASVSQTLTTCKLAGDFLGRALSLFVSSRVPLPVRVGAAGGATLAGVLLSVWLLVFEVDLSADTCSVCDAQPEWYQIVTVLFIYSLGTLNENSVGTFSSLSVDETKRPQAQRFVAFMIYGGLTAGLLCASIPILLRPSKGE
uniref:Nodulin-like domain-containing protein n=1 Tax=Chromera velia CCMP2878 TaxID=1169474 RepID=A0A0G4HLJ7_9ALVE|eukprot:Cvel_7382.t1-p1 / transcript=Cvel_7382.t1 / gene=Cvel_7382 / organism=Chromera_velia_CCMP2878 / gene_product=hypothetical protein / transcript_product=hypothetical protein / location=Cvel_scaffold384:55568-60684(-) / protein_length=647 / sequence_SO=supercontig / SO=protein_coding / is_pseudo=false